jgi:hypothetical protein
MKEFTMPRTEYLPFTHIGFSSTPPSAETAALTGSLTGGALGLVASLMGFTIPLHGPMVAVSPMLTTLTGVAFGAAVGGVIGLVAEAGLGSDHMGYFGTAAQRDDALGKGNAARTDDSLFERVAELVRNSDATGMDLRVANWRDSGWTGWNASAAEAERERRVYGVHPDPLTRLPTTADPEADLREATTIRK